MPLPANITRHAVGIGRWTGPAASNGILYYINKQWNGLYRAALVIHHHDLPPYFYAETLDEVSRKLEAI